MEIELEEFEFERIGNVKEDSFIDDSVLVLDLYLESGGLLDD